MTDHEIRNLLTHHDPRAVALLCVEADVAAGEYEGTSIAMEISYTEHLSRVERIARQHDPAVMILAPAELIRPTVYLLGADGDAFALIAAVCNALENAGNSRAVIEAFIVEAAQSDYEHVLQTARTFAEVQ